VKHGAAMPAQQTSSIQFSASIPAWQTSSMQYGGYGASKSLHATLHAAPFIPTPHGGAMPPVHCSMGGAGGGGAEGGGEGGNFSMLLSLLHHLSIPMVGVLIIPRGQMCRQYH